MSPARLILASASPRRRELLTQAGFSFDVLPADIDETIHSEEKPATYVQRLALEKALALHGVHPSARILGADTTVVLNGDVLGKPADRAEAEEMLRALSGNVHQVHTGIAVVAGESQRLHVETTNVFFSSVTSSLSLVRT